MPELVRRLTRDRSPLATAFPAQPRPAETAAQGAGRIRLWEVAVLAALTFVALLIRVQDPETMPARMAGVESTAGLGAALPGAALIPVAYLLMRRLFSARTAVITAAFLAFHAWLLVFSRAGLVWYADESAAYP